MAVLLTFEKVKKFCLVLALSLGVIGLFVDILDSGTYDIEFGDGYYDYDTFNITCNTYFGWKEIRVLGCNKQLMEWNYYSYYDIPFGRAIDPMKYSWGRYVTIVFLV